MDRGRPPAFGDALRAYRVAAGLTQEDLAERTGLSREAVSALERGARRRPHPYTVRRLAETLRLAEAERLLFEAAARGPRGADTGRPDAWPTLPPPLPLIGRMHELALLERHLAGERPPLLLLAGEPGIGKTRLLQEAAGHGAGHGLRVLQGGCRQRGGQEPYAPLLGALARHVHALTAAQARLELRGCAWLVRLLPELADGPIEPLPAWTLSPEQERRLMFAAVERFLGNVAGPAGTLLVLDDLQWAGPDALDLLRTLAHAAGEVRLRVVGAYRDTEVSPDAPLSALLADLAHAGLAAQRAVHPLTADEAGQVLELLLEGSADAAGEVRARVVQRAGGVPFFLVSYAQGLRLGEGDRLAEVVPWDVAHSVRQRVAALPAAAREILGVAAVAGRVIARALFTAVTGHPAQEVVGTLEDIRRTHLLEEAGAHAYRFTHDLIREVVEADLGAARRAHLHQQVAQALEGMPGEPPAEALAYHYAQTEEHEKAAHWLERAGDQAAAGFAHAAAVEHYAAAREHLLNGAVEALSRLDEKLGDLRMRLGEYAQAQEDFARAGVQETDPARRVELRRKEGVTWMARGEFARALDLFAAAEEEARLGRAVPTTVRAAVDLSHAEVYGYQSNFEAAEAAAQRALALLSAEHSSRDVECAQARAVALLGQVARERGDMAVAEACLRRSLAIMERLGDQEGIATSWEVLGDMTWHRGELAPAEEYYRRGLAVRERTGDQGAIVRCLLALAEILTLRQDGAGADETLRRSLALAERSGDQFGIAGTLLWLGWLAVWRGDCVQAEESFRRSLALMERIGAQGNIGWAWHALGWLALCWGDLAEAEACWRCSLAIMERIGHPGGSAFCWNGLGWVALRRGDLAEAEACWRRSLTILGRTDDQTCLAWAWSGLGWVACERGDLRAAATWCRRARRLARHIGVPTMETLATLGQTAARLRQGRLRAAAAVLTHARTLATAHGLAQPTVEATLLTAELHLRQGVLPEAQVAAEEVLATGGQWRREEALARCLLGQCALARGVPAEAEAHLRTALGMQTEMGAALEAARSRLALAEAVVAGSQTGCIPEEARTVLAQARTQVLASGAARDVKDVERVEQALSALQSASPCACDASAQTRPSLPVRQRVMAHAPAGRRLARPERQAWALEHLRTVGPLSPRAYATTLAVSVDTALLDLRELLDKGLVRAEGTTRNRRYVLAGRDKP